MAPEITILLADHQTLFREGLRTLLDRTPGFEVVGEAATGREAVEMTRTLRPDVLVTEVTLPELNGIEAARVIRSRQPQTKIAVLSGAADAELLFRAFDAGATAYLLKISTFDDIVAGLRAACGGRRYVCAALRNSEPGQAALHGESPLQRLSRRETQVLQLVVEGRTSADIAEDAHLSRKTVDTYRSRIMKKLGVPDTVSLVKFAIQHGLTAG